MTPNVNTVLTELRRHGVTAYRLDSEHVRLIPKGAVTPALIALVLDAKPALLPLLPPLPAEPPTVAPSAAADLLATYGTRGDLAVQVWAETHGHPDVLRVFGQLARRVDALAEGTDEAAYRGAVERLAGYLQAIRAAYEAATAPTDAPEPVATITPRWRLAITSTKLRPPPFRLDAARTIVGDVAQHVEIILAKLEIAVEHRNADRRGSFYSESADEWLGELRLCGVDASMEALQ
jgi:hypothetical protein